MINRLSTYLISSLCIFVVACDPGTYYRPMKLHARSDLQWEYPSKSATLILGLIGGFDGNNFILLEGTLVNNSEADHILLSKTELVTAQGTFTGSISPHDKPVPPRGKIPIEISWRFRDPLMKVLIEPIKLMMYLKVGDVEQIIEIPLVRK